MNGQNYISYMIIRKYFKYKIHKYFALSYEQNQAIENNLIIIKLIESWYCQSTYYWYYQSSNL